MATILIVTDDPVFFSGLAGALRGRGHLLISKNGILETDRFLRQNRIEAVVADLKLSDAEGPGLVSLIRDRSPEARVFAVADRYSREIDLKLRTEGVLHFAIKPVDPDQLAESILHGLPCRQKATTGDGKNSDRTGAVE